jgi:tripartite ATP-independent transporter DctP family solute receptor
MRRLLSTAFVALLFGLALPARAADDVVTVKVATVAPEGSPWAVALQDWKKIAEAAAPAGKLKIKLFLGGTLGDEKESVLAVKRGQIQVAAATTGAFASQVPELAVFELPYLFKGYEEADYVLDNVVKKDVEKACTDRGLVFGLWSENGFRSFGGKFPVTKPEDLKGKKMRSQESGIHLEMYRAFGASPVPIPTTEALTALQTGVVDGYDQAPLYAFAASWHTASTHWSVSNHIYQPAAIIYNKAAYDSWSPEIKAAIAKASGEVLTKLRTQVRAMSPILLENLKASGITVNVLTEEQRQPFMKLSEKARENYMKTASAGEKAMYQKIVKGLGDFRAQKK